MDWGAPKSAVFRAERGGKSHFRRKVPSQMRLGPSGRRFDPCHSDQNFDRKQSLFSAFGHFLCSFRYFTATFEKIAFSRPHHEMWTENSFIFVYSSAKIKACIIRFSVRFCCPRQTKRKLAGLPIQDKFSHYQSKFVPQSLKQTPSAPIVLPERNVRSAIPVMLFGR